MQKYQNPKKKASYEQKKSKQNSPDSVNQSIVGSSKLAKCNGTNFYYRIKQVSGSSSPRQGNSQNKPKSPGTQNNENAQFQKILNSSTYFVSKQFNNNNSSNNKSQDKHENKQLNQFQVKKFKIQ
eukprot:TRINITY_DN49365_c0_g1_i1.p3 TRINITY_DN49365_c0_g1~~TRINITY_DN49365_c0_g1_i1.p3  ORF type:complete len:125 (-),score=11.69 TRINITY_DN49365_c0_g1_i1:8-382(-)